MAEQSESVQVELDGVSAAYLRRKCSNRADLATAAAAALHELAVADAARADARWQAEHIDEVTALIEDGEAALAEAS